MENYENYIPKKATIIKLKKETLDIKTFTLKFPKKINYKPGQFFMLGLLGYGEVPISVSSYDDNTDRIDFSIRKVGLVTSGLHSLELNDEVSFRGPYGNGYNMKQFEGKDIIIIGGGCGAAPMKAIIDYITDKRELFNDIDIFFGFKNFNEILYRDYYDKLKDYKINVHLSLDHPDRKWDGYVGFVTNLLDDTLKEKYTIKGNIRNGDIRNGDIRREETAKINARKIDSAISKEKTSKKIVTERNTEIKNIGNSDIIAIVCGPPIMIKFVIKILSKYNIDITQIYLSMEKLVYCGIGKCGHCRLGRYYICKDGPVFNAKDIIEYL